MDVMFTVLICRPSQLIGRPNVNNKIIHYILGLKGNKYANYAPV